MTKKFLFYTFIFIPIFYSCNKNKKLEYALLFSKKNRTELEKVLTYYTDSGYKYKAACFLIENMPYYYSYSGNTLDSLRKIQANLLKKRKLDKSTKDKLKLFSYSNLQKIYDSHIITADYLIENIDLAFAVWESSPWKKDYSFNDFCEWVLPYRIGDEPLENWRPTFTKKYLAILDSIYHGSDVVVATDSIMKILMTRKTVFNTELHLPRLGAFFLEKHNVGYCRESCDFTTYVLRSVGIPAGTDFFQFSPEVNGGHSWNVIKDTTGKVIPFEYEMPKRKGKRNINDRKKGKVYRLCFEKQTREWGNYFEKDVTDEYFGKNSVKIEIISEKFSKQHIYIGVFSSGTWEPVANAQLCHYSKNIIVNNIEPEVIFIPLSYVNNKLQPIGFPFWLKDNKVSYFRQSIKKENINIYRKYPLRKWTRWSMKEVVGAKIKLSNTLDFKEYETLFEITDTPPINYNIIYCNPKKKYRYIQYKAPSEKRVHIAELMFYRNKKDTIKITPKVIIGNSPFNSDESKVKEKAFDGDFLTYYQSKEKGDSMIVDLGNPEKIEKLIYIPRNDENFIRINDKYELFYQDGINGWITLGQQTPTKPYLSYKNIPQNVILWLRNLSRGHEEEIFFIKDGKQCFLCNDDDYDGR